MLLFQNPSLFCTVLSVVGSVLVVVWNASRGIVSCVVEVFSTQSVDLGLDGGLDAHYYGCSLSIRMLFMVAIAVYLESNASGMVSLWRELC